MTICERIPARAPSADCRLIAIVKSLRSLWRLCAIGAGAQALASIALLINCAIVPLGVAQVVALPQPQFTHLDANDVDLLSANVYLQETDASIGSKEHPLTHTWFSGPDGTWTGGSVSFQPLQFASHMDDYSPAFIQWPNGGVCPTTGGRIYVPVIVGHSSELFATGYAQDYCHTFTATQPTGDTLTGSGSVYTLTRRDGTQITFSGSQSEAQQTIYPDGRVLTYGYDANGWPQSVTRSDGPQLKYTWQNESINGFQFTGLISVTAINGAFDYCNPTAATCSPKMAWPTATYSYAAGSGGGIVLTVTASSGAVTVYTMDSYGRTTDVRLPSSTTGNNILYTYCGSSCAQYSSYPLDAFAYNYVAGVTRNNQLWTYSGAPAQPFTGGVCGFGCTNYPIQGTTATYGFTNPVGGSETVEQSVCVNSEDAFDAAGCMVPGTDPFIQITDEQGNVFYGPGALISQETKPLKNENQYTWDSRGNLTQVEQVSKSGAQGPTELANYNTTCTNSLTCNEPNWIEDGNGNKTNFTYNPNNGMVTSVIRPPDANGILPETNYTYTQQSAYVLNSSGQYVASPPIWVKATESYCISSQASTDTTTGQVDCSNGDKVLKTFYYGPNSSSGPNNLFLRGEEITADGQSRVTCYGYDRFGNQISETTPNAGLSLTSCDQFTVN